MKNQNKKKTVIVAMSGGVDSSVAAYLLLKEGYNVVGIHMRLIENSEKGEVAARTVARRLGIRYYPVNASHSFKQEVVDYFLSSYEQGQTPNPCVVCNRTIKFGVLLKQLEVFEGDWLATGHYVRIADCRLPIADSPAGEADCHFKLLRGVDQAKDQSYFLYTLTQEKLKRILFPLGGYTKDEVRKIADQEKLPDLAGESQDVCFMIEDGKIIDHNEFLKARLELKPGPIVALYPSGPSGGPPPLRKGRNNQILKRAGDIVGKHQGLPLYTIGQRRGVEIGGTGPYYVVRADYKTNTLYVTADHDDPALLRNEFVIKNTNWISGQAPDMPFECEVVIRYRHKAVGCKILPQKSSNLQREIGALSAGDYSFQEYIVVLKEPQRAVTPGQSAVIYLGDEVIGGGVIK